MAKRYELSANQWRRIADLLPGKVGDPGRSGDDNRRFVSGVLWVRRSGVRWHDLLPRYGKCKSVHKRFTLWAKAGVWERVFESLTADPDNDYLMLDSSLVRAHQQAATGEGGPEPGSGALPRRTDHQDPLGHRYPGPAASRHPDPGPGRRCATSTSPDPGLQGQAWPRRRRLRQQPHTGLYRRHRRQRRHPLKSPQTPDPARQEHLKGPQPHQALLQQAIASAMLWIP